MSVLMVNAVMKVQVVLIQSDICSSFQQHILLLDVFSLLFFFFYCIKKYCIINFQWDKKDKTFESGVNVESVITLNDSTLQILFMSL